MRLALVRLRPDLSGFYRVAARRGFLSPGDDGGYALHAALTAAFGAAAPRPFALRQIGREAEILGYTTASPEEMRALAAVSATGDMADLAATILAAPPEIKPMPETWPSGVRLAFRVRVRPIMRVRLAGPDGPHREVDAYAHARFLACRRPGPNADVQPTREGVYAAWLTERIERDGAAKVEWVALDAYRSVRTLRRPRAEDGRRSVAITEGPDATLKGVLRIEDGDAFGRLLAKGIGRHRSFGFGMLLLSPPGKTLC